MVFCLAFALTACGDDDGNGQDDAATQNDADTQDDAATEADAATHDDTWLGTACSCTPDSECIQMGVPKPNAGTIAGCEGVPLPWTGADLVCLRTYSGMLATDTFFANGYCGLMATTCTGDTTICDSAVFGDYAAMTACPADSVMITDAQDVDVLGMTAHIENKLCAASCDTSADCRTTEEDPVLNNDPTQYDCIDKDGVKFCYDPRNLSATYTATQF